MRLLAFAIVLAALVLGAAALAVLGIRALGEPNGGPRKGVLRVLARPGQCWSVATGRNEMDLGAADSFEGCGIGSMMFDPGDGFEAQISNDPPTKEQDLGATIVVDGEVVRQVRPGSRIGLRVRYGDDLPEQFIVLRIEAPAGRCWSAVVDSTTERGCGARLISLGETSIVSVIVEPETPGVWPLFVAFEADGQVVQTFGPTTGQYPSISGGYAVPNR